MNKLLNAINLTTLNDKLYEMTNSIYALLRERKMKLLIEVEGLCDYECDDCDCDYECDDGNQDCDCIW